MHLTLILSYNSKFYRDHAWCLALDIHKGARDSREGIHFAAGRGIGHYMHKDIEAVA
ncbi:hypothetical protein BS78_02G057900 [Paspalum vaginatum]|nr:hypothetical protein BS78_02G057900 [Paspalum vaginatum]